MAELIPHDIYENIFLRLDARNLISCKNVCKSWKSLISKYHFIKAHLNRSYKSNENGHKRIGQAVFLYDIYPYSMIGYSNGLVCIIDRHELLVANPLTREVKHVPMPFSCKFNWEVICGFGYDSIRDDYKVVCGVMKGGGQTCFHVFSLKSNAWHVIEKVNYTCVPVNSGVGVIYNGAIHWVMHPKYQTENVILSFDLSKEEFKEIPQPDYPMKYISLGIMEECLCIRHSRQLWVMKKYNEKQSWGVVNNYQMKFEYPLFKVGNDTFTGDMSFNSNNVESLVSPHLQPENEVSEDEDEDDSGSDSDADDVKCIDGMSIDSHGSDKVRGQKRKFVDFDDQIDSASQSFRALKRLAGAKSEYDDTSGAKVENEDTSDITDGILSNEDFQRIKELKAKKDAKLVLANHGILKKASDPKSEPFRVPSSDQVSLKMVDGYTLEANIRKKMTREERKALIKAGREDSVKYQSKAAVKQKKTGGLSNKQKEHKKAMPIAAKRSKIEKSKRQKKIKQRGADKQFRGHKAWK